MFAKQVLDTKARLIFYIVKEKKKMKILLMKKSPKKLKNIEIISTSGYTIDYNAEILNPFNSELQLKDTVS